MSTDPGRDRSRWMHLGQEPKGHVWNILSLSIARDEPSVLLPKTSLYTENDTSCPLKGTVPAFSSTPASLVFLSLMHHSPIISLIWKGENNTTFLIPLSPLCSKTHTSPISSIVHSALWLKTWSVEAEWLFWNLPPPPLLAMWPWTSHLTPLSYKSDC